MITKWIDNIMADVETQCHDASFVLEPPPRTMHAVSNWVTLSDQPLSRQSIKQLLSNTIPTIRKRQFLSAHECSRLVDIVKTHRIGTYNQEIVFPPVGSAGITQFDYQRGRLSFRFGASFRQSNAVPDKEAYFNGVDGANSLQERFRREANIDVLARVTQALEEATGLPVRIAKEDDKDYFAGLLRVVGDNSVQIHPDYAPYDGPEWEIGHIVAQLTWNVLLRQVPGGDTIIYDRQWQGAADDVVFRKKFPRYAYSPSGLEGHLFKVMPAIEGDLTFFNPRNFHEVKSCDRELGGKTDELRYTISSFIGLLPETSVGGPALILWS